jgi:hypothetical protein
MGVHERYFNQFGWAIIIFQRRDKHIARGLPSPVDGAFSCAIRDAFDLNSSEGEPGSLSRILELAAF